MQRHRSKRSLLDENERYVSRAAYKLESVASDLGLDFKNMLVLDVGSSTGGFTDFALKHGAKVVIAVDKGTDQLNKLLRYDRRVEVYEKTDIRDFKPSVVPDIVLIDVSFISLRDVLPCIRRLCSKNTLIVAMVKPQFEAKSEKELNDGVVKNERYRRSILRDFELWLKPSFVLLDKVDSKIEGLKGNKERFYKLKCSK